MVSGCVTSTIEIPSLRPTKTIFKKYHIKYQGTSGQYCLSAYDLMKYISNLLQKYGTDFNKYLVDEPINTSIASYNFHYEMIGTKEEKSNKQVEEINYIENKHAYLLKFYDFEWIKVNNE